MIKLKVYRKERLNGGYSYYAPIVNEFNNKKCTYYLTINFKKGTEPRDESLYINIKKFFFSSFYFNGSANVKIIVTEYEKTGDSPADLKNYNIEKEEYAEFGNIELDDSDLAF